MRGGNGLDFGAPAIEIGIVSEADLAHLHGPGADGGFGHLDRSGAAGDEVEVFVVFGACVGGLVTHGDELGGEGIGLGCVIGVEEELERFGIGGFDTVGI